MAETLMPSMATQAALNSAIATLNSNIYSGTTTNDILTDATSIGGTKVFTGTGGSYTGTVPNINYKYGVFFCTKRGSSVHVVACSEYDEYATNTWTGSSWTGWKELALKDNIANCVKYKTVVLNSSDIGTSFSQTARNIGSSSSLLGVSAIKIASIFTNSANFSPPANITFGTAGNNVWAATSQSTTLTGGISCVVGYFD